MGRKVISFVHNTNVAAGIAVRAAGGDAAHGLVVVPRPTRVVLVLLRALPLSPKIAVAFVGPCLQMHGPCG